MCTPHRHLTRTQGAFGLPIFPSLKSETSLHCKHLPALENIACVWVMYMLIFVRPQCDRRQILPACLGQGLPTRPVAPKTDPRVGCRPQRLSRGIWWQGILKGPKSEGMHSKEQNGLAQESSMHSHRGRATQLLGGQTTKALLKCLGFTFYVYWALTKKHRITTNLRSQALDTTSSFHFHRGAEHLG